jgi:hypothetical protein
VSASCCGLFSRWLVDRSRLYRMYVCACVCACVCLQLLSWMTTVANLNIAYTNVIGDSIVAAGTIAYLGAFTSEFRHMLVDDWLASLKSTSVPHTDGTNVCSTLANPVEVRPLLVFACCHGVLPLLCSQL